MDLLYSETVARIKSIKAEIARLRQKVPNLSQSDTIRATELAAEVIELREHADRSQWTRSDQIARGVRDGRYRLEGEGSGINPYRSGDDYDYDPIGEPNSVADHRDRRYRNPWDMSEVRMWGRDPGEVAAELRSRALACIEKMPGALPQHPPSGDQHHRRIRLQRLPVGPAVHCHQQAGVSAGLVETCVQQAAQPDSG